MRYLFGQHTLDTDARRLSRGGDTLHLSRKAFNLLVLLVEGRQRVIPKQEIFEELWPETFVVEANLANLIAEIRRAIADAGHEIIRTVHGTGYSFAVPVLERETVVQGSRAFVHVLIHDSEEHRLAEGENIVGRAPTSDIFLASGSVSRRHALITVTGDEATVTDLESKHGTFLGEEAVRSEVPLLHGNALRFGKVETVYRRWTAADPTDSFLLSEL